MSVKFKADLELKDAITYLDNVLENLKKGKVVVQYGKDYATFEPDNNVKLEIKAEGKEGKGKLNLSLSYKKSEAPVENTEMQITDVEPVVEEVKESLEETKQELANEVDQVEDAGSTNKKGKRKSKANA